MTKWNVNHGIASRSLISASLSMVISTQHSKLNDLRKIICLRKSESSVVRISVYNVLENFAEHGIHCRPCFYTGDFIDMLP